MKVSLNETYLFRLFRMKHFAILLAFLLTLSSAVAEGITFSSEPESFYFNDMKIPYGHEYFEVGDSFICKTDIVATVGADFGLWKNSAENGKVKKYSNRAFGITLLSDDTVKFSDKAPMSPGIGRFDIKIRGVNGLELHYGDRVKFGILKKPYRSDVFQLTSFNLSVGTAFAHSTCEKL